MADAGQWDVTVVRSYTNSGKPDELAKFKSVTGVTVTEGALVLDSGSEVAAVFAAGQWVTFYRDVHLTEFAELTF